MHARAARNDCSQSMPQNGFCASRAFRMTVIPRSWRAAADHWRRGPLALPRARTLRGRAAAACVCRSAPARPAHADLMRDGRSRQALQSFRRSGRRLSSQRSSAALRRRPCGVRDGCRRRSRRAAGSAPEELRRAISSRSGHGGGNRSASAARAHGRGTAAQRAAPRWFSPAHPPPARPAPILNHGRARWSPARWPAVAIRGHLARR